MSVRQTAFAYAAFAAGGLVAGLALSRLLESLRPRAPSIARYELQLLMDALRFSSDKHKDQRRKNPHQHPYINHPIRVAHILANDVAISDINVIIAALLHDTVEDTDTSLEEIEASFGPVVASIVDEVSDDKTLPKQTRKRLQVENAWHASPEARLVKLADKLDNLTDLLEVTPIGWQPERVLEYFDWSQEVVAVLSGTNAILESRIDQVLSRRQSAAALASASLA